MPGSPPSERTRRFSSSNATGRPGRQGEGRPRPDSMTLRRRSICRAMISMCLSWIDTPWRAVDLLDLVDQVLLPPCGPRIRSTSCGSGVPWVSCWPTSTWSPSSISSRERLLMGRPAPRRRRRDDELARAEVPEDWEPGKAILFDTTLGRALFNDALPSDYAFVNQRSASRSSARSSTTWPSGTPRSTCGVASTR